MPDTSKTVIVLCKEATQLLVADKTQKSQTERSYETPSTLCSPWVRILTLVLDLNLQLEVSISSCLVWPLCSSVENRT